MSILKNVFNMLTDNRNIKEPIIYKKSNETSTFLNQLTALKESNNANLDRKKVESHLKLFSIGQTGEEQVLFELQNTMLPYLVLHDVYLEFEDYKAQLDFIVITHKSILILEVKKLFGNIRVTDKGEFQRVITKNNRVVNKEGMYSPINQVERHVAILEKLLKSSGTIAKCPINYAVTFANSKTILDISKSAPSAIQSKIIRHDQIKSFIKKELEKKSPVLMLDHHLYQIADKILQNSKEKTFNVEDYTLTTPQSSQKDNLTNDPPVFNNHLLLTDENLKTLLTDFRLKRSKELNVKPYYIFTNKILDQLIEKKPLTPEQLIEIEGIGHKKVEEFGNDILSIIQRDTKSHLHHHVLTSLPKEKSSTPFTKDSVEILTLSLTQFRTKRAKELNVKPYYIFTNRTLEALLEKRPVTIPELLKIEGIGPKKAEEFGLDILKIMNSL